MKLNVLTASIGLVLGFCLISQNGAAAAFLSAAATTVEGAGYAQFGCPEGQAQGIWEAERSAMIDARSQCGFEARRVSPWRYSGNECRLYPFPTASGAITASARFACIEN